MYVQPCIQRIKFPLATIVRVPCVWTRENSTFDHKIAVCGCLVAPEQFHHFEIKFDISSGILALRREIGGRANGDYASLPVKRAPLKFVDLVTAQSGHDGQ